MLYERHAEAARALARHYVSPADAEDVVADAFSKLFEMLRRGAGPDTGFRPYLYTVVRHRSFDVSRGAARTRPSTDDEIESVLGRVASEEDPALAGFERSVVSRAYFDLPERWREVLWYVLVDDLKPAQVAPVLGLSPNGVSALLYRAKEALRAGYLQQHLTHAPSDTCRTVNPLLGGYVRDSLSKRETAKIDDHLATCGTCSALVLELHDVAHGMKTVIAPLVLGAGGLALVGAGAPIGGMFVAAKAGAGAAVSGAPTATATVGAASTSTLSGAVSSAVSATASAVSATAGAVASAAAAAAGGSVAAGALAVAAVTMVAALQIGAPADAEPVLADQTTTTTDGRELPGAEGINGNPVLPTDIEPGESTSISYLAVEYTDASKPLVPRQPQKLALTISNTGETATTGTQLQITLPSGLTVTRPDGPFGTGVGSRLAGSVEPTADTDAAATGTGDSSGTDSASASGSAADGSTEAGAASDGDLKATPGSSPSTPATVGQIPEDGPAACTPTEQANVLLCSLGEVAPGQDHHVEVPVQASSGGDYPVGAEVWADGIEHRAIDLQGRTVAPFGPELTAASADVSLASPGIAALPVRVSSTGDRAVPVGWAVEVTLPDGVSPTKAQPELTCTSGAPPNGWLCAPLAGTATALEPGVTLGTTLNITTAAAASSAEPTTLGAVNLRPVVPQGNARSVSATLAVTSAWANAGKGVGDVVASCVTEGGASTANAVVTGTYTNTTERTVRVALKAAGSSASSGRDVAPGAATQLTVPDGMRVPAGQAAFVLATMVDGKTYTTPVPAGDHNGADCYSPSWSTETSAETYNWGGTVAVKGTVTNRSDESLTAVMVVPVGDTTMESPGLPVAPGSTLSLSVNTDRMHLAEGDVTFRLSRDGLDTDGDQPAGPVVPTTNPTAHHGGATIAPAVGDAPVTAGVCEFDVEQDHSVRTFAFTADNTGSTLPVRFHVGDVTRTVPAGEITSIEFPVVWGTETATLMAANEPLATMPVSFESCAELTWPEAVSVSAAAQCTDQRVHLTATVSNGTDRDWMGVLLRESSSEIGSPQKVVAGQATTLELTRETAISREGNVTVRLTRQLEGREHTVERQFVVPGKACFGNVCEPTPAATTAASVATDARPPRWPWFEVCSDPTAGES
ncbi:sigma-70 family RNA polymerase sigma factor [Promicromonospora umidemergens]|uniref:RNA polymerase sigma factor (Sigma-70 family) n=1 Tax=Promicromonospora umidemergens TaxID=629679 RepID=A0ABP8WXB7_9MICO|nr:sigma-70 family RNA polymerase sigma factor [Promicromonospora umidemergens]